MSVLQGRKSREHRPFWTAWSAAGISFRHPNFVCKITLWVREIVFCRKEKSQKTAKTATKRHKKKAVIPKNCFVYLNSKIDNSISYQLLAKSHRRFRSTGFHLVSCGQDESLVISRSFFYCCDISVLLFNNVYIFCVFSETSFHAPTERYSQLIEVFK